VHGRQSYLSVQDPSLKSSQTPMINFRQRSIPDPYHMSVENLPSIRFLQRSSKSFSRMADMLDLKNQKMRRELNMTAPGFDPSLVDSFYEYYFKDESSINVTSTPNLPESSVFHPKNPYVKERIKKSPWNSNRASNIQRIPIPKPKLSEKPLA